MELRIYSHHYKGKDLLEFQEYCKNSNFFKKNNVYRSDSSAVLQLVFTMKEFQERYSKEGHKHLETCKNYGPNCFECQISKIARALCGDEENDRV